MMGSVGLEDKRLGRDPSPSTEEEAFLRTVPIKLVVLDSRITQKNLGKSCL
jgi:hypothetical protein